MLQELLLLFLLGSGGWMLFRVLRLPVPGLLGTIVVIGGLRATGFDLPTSPPFLIYLIQVLLGFFVGSRVTADTVYQLKSMLLPALLVVTWALFIALFFGYILSAITFLDGYTSILSSSMGGLPEITVIGVATGADVAVVILMQTLRMVISIVAFPFLLKYWMRSREGEEKELGLSQASERNGEPLQDGGRESTGAGVLEEKAAVPGFFSGWALTLKNGLLEFREVLLDKLRAIKVMHFPSLLRGLLALLAAAGGGALFHQLGIPAGTMLGSTLVLVVISLFLFPVRSPSSGVFSFMLIGVGLIVSDNISPATLDTLSSGEILFPALLATLVIFATSLLVAYLISKLAAWDYPTSFLAAAPGGFTVMVSLAITHGKDPLRVSMIHLSRLLALKTVIPLYFWFLI